MSALPAVAIAALLYAAGLRRAARWPAARGAWFASGLAVVWVALGPLDGPADARLSAHMVQHGLLALVAPPLLAAGAPVSLALRALHGARRQRLAARLRTRSARVLSQPATGAAALSAVMLATHLTGLYALALRQPGVHVAEHAAYLAAGWLFWAPLVGADPLPSRPGAVGRVAWLMSAMPAMGIVGAWLLAGPVRYAAYAGPGALADQRRAAALMWAGGSLALCAGVVVLAAAALLGEERRQVRRETARGAA